MNIFFSGFLIFLPMGLANMTPPLIKNQFKFLSRPINQKLFGDHKTWRGLISGTIVGGIVFLPIYYLAQDYPWYLGLVLGFGALAGDLLKSFFKRRLNIAPGRSWMPFDQIDYTLGGLCLGSLFIFISWPVWLIIIGGGLLLHWLANYTGYLLKIQKNKW